MSNKNLIDQMKFLTSRFNFYKINCLWLNRKPPKCKSGLQNSKRNLKCTYNRNKILLTILPRDWK